VVGCGVVLNAKGAAQKKGGVSGGGGEGGSRGGLAEVHPGGGSTWSLGGQVREGGRRRGERLRASRFRSGKSWGVWCRQCGGAGSSGGGLEGVGAVCVGGRAKGVPLSGESRFVGVGGQVYKGVIGRGRGKYGVACWCGCARGGQRPFK